MKQLSHTETNNLSSEHHITLLCDGIVLPANIGAIFRLADAFRVEEVIFSGTDIDLSSRKIKQVSRSTHQWINHRKSSDLAVEISQLKEKDYLIVALEITDQSTDLQHYPVGENQKTALIIGSETQGIRAEILDMVDQAVEIKMFGKNSSLNVSNSLAIALFRLTTSA